jgi:hypothetical protein
MGKWWYIFITGIIWTSYKDLTSRLTGRMGLGDSGNHPRPWHIMAHYFRSVNQSSFSRYTADSSESCHSTIILCEELWNLVEENA